MIVIGLASVVLLGWVLLTSGKSTDAEDGIMAGWNMDLIKYKSPYIGDASNASNLLNELPFGEHKQKLVLHTDEEPYGLTAEYDLTRYRNTEDHDFIYKTFRRNSVVMFSLIDNLDFTCFSVKMRDSSNSYEFTRSDLQIYFDRDLREYSKSEREFAVLLIQMPGF